MTRYEAKSIYDDRKVILIDKRAFNIFVDKIFDELETKSCEGCIHHKAYNGNFPLSCCECSRFYSDNFEEMKK